MRAAGSLLLFLLLLRPPAAPAGEAWAEMSGMTAVPALSAADRGRVEKGDLVHARVPDLSFPRGQIMETVFLVDGPLGKTVEAWRAWNGTSRGDLKVYLHGEVPAGPGPEWQPLAQPPEEEPVRALARATLEAGAMRREVQLSGDERQRVPRGGAEDFWPAAVNSFWTGVLTERARLYRQGGLPAQQPLLMGVQQIALRGEMDELLEAAPHAAAHFRPLLEALGVAGRPAGRTPLFYELGNVRGRAAVSLQASATALGQTADLQVYSSGGAYTTLTLQQLWPLLRGGQPVTLVWRGDFIAAGPLGELRGLERTAAAGAISKEVRNSVAAFQKEAAVR